MINSVIRLGLACLVALAPAAAHSAPPSLQLSGFGTIGVVAIDQSDLRFARVGVDHLGSESPDFGPDTVIGIHGNLVFSPRTALVAQVLSRESPRGDYNPRAALAFLSHNISQTLTVRVGRLRIPFFMLSDSLDINYANPWIRPPVEVYGLNPFTDLDGVDLLFRTRIGSADLEIHPYLGKSYITFHRSGNAQLKELVGINLTITTEQLTFFLGHGESRLKLKWSDPDFLRLSASLPPAVSGELAGDDGHAAFSALGLQWDSGDWLLIGEYARRVNRRYANSAHGWHFTVGRRFDSLMPYLTLARQTEDRPVTTATTGSPVIDPMLDNFLASRNMAQRSITLGTRWDFRDDAALKLEISHARSIGNSWGSFFPHGDPVTTDLRNRRVNMLGVSLDVTF